MASKFVPWVNDSNVSSNTVDVSSKVATGFQSGNKAIAKEVNAVLRSTSVVVSCLMDTIAPSSNVDYTSPTSDIKQAISDGLKTVKVTDATNADKLKTAITIGGVSFDGSSNINLPGVNTAGNQNTSGLSGGFSYTTSVPTSANVNGLKIALLTSEPQVRYDGWIYIVSGS